MIKYYMFENSAYGVGLSILTRESGSNNSNCVRYPIDIRQIKTAYILDTADQLRRVYSKSQAPLSNV